MDMDLRRITVERIDVACDGSTLIVEGKREGGHDTCVMLDLSDTVRRQLALDLVDAVRA